MTLLGLVLASVIGLSLGVLGGGGSILAVPVFVYVLGVPAKPAIAMSLPVVGATSLIGALHHWRAGNVRVRTAIAFGAVAMVGSYAGARFAAFVRGPVQLMLLGLVMFGAAASMFRKSTVATPNAPTEAAAGPVPFAPLALVALGVGLLTGLVGIGGGFLIVPALVVLGRIPMKTAVGTSLVVIAMNSAAASLGYLGQVELSWELMLGFSAASVVGIIAGSHLVRFLSPAALTRAFAIFLLLIGALVLYQNWNALA